MRIALSVSAGGWGGVPHVAELLARGLAGRGHELAVLGWPGSPLAERLRGVAAFHELRRGADLDPRAVVHAARVLRRCRPQLVLTLMKKDVRITGPAARARGIPLIIRHANDQPLKAGLYHRMLYGWLPDHHVTNAESTRRTLLDSARWLDPTSVSVIRNGLELRDYDVAPARLDTPPGALRIGYIGAFEPRKGLLDLAAAWPALAAELPEAWLVLVGSGSQEEQLRARLAGQPRVLWTGWRQDLPAVLHALDIMVLPSYVEGAPNAVQQAMAAGVPVVATAVSGTPELLADGAQGLLVPPGAPELLREALGRLAHDAPLRARLGEAGRRRAAAEFTLDRMLDAYEDLFRRFVRAG